MNTLTTRIVAAILSLAMFSCTAVEEDATQPTPQPTPEADLSVLMELVNQSWDLKDCPTGSTLNLEGYTECDYLSYMSFTEESVFIRHGNNTYFTDLRNGQALLNSTSSAMRTAAWKRTYASRTLTSRTAPGTSTNRYKAGRKSGVPMERATINGFFI
jgi:hypothetical protein